MDTCMRRVLLGLLKCAISYIFCPLRETGWKSQCLHRICNVLPSSVEEGPVKALGAVRATAGSGLFHSCASPTSLGAWFPCSQETSWHKMVAGAPAIASNIPGRQAGKGWRTNPTPTPPHIPLILPVSSSLRPTHGFANLPAASPSSKGRKPVFQLHGAG